MSAPADVLAVMDRAVMPLPGTRAELREARAAVAELIEAMRSAEALAHCCMSIDGYSREEIAEMARASVGMYTAALARVKGVQS